MREGQRKGRKGKEKEGKGSGARGRRKD